MKEKESTREGIERSRWLGACDAPLHFAVFENGCAMERMGVKNKGDCETEIIGLLP